MPERRILSIWFPRLGAERILRHMSLDPALPFATVRDSGQMQVLFALNSAAEAAGLHAGQPLRDAHAMCAGLVTKAAHAPSEMRFLQSLARWAEALSPWVSVDGPTGLMLDITGCAHLFGGEGAMLEQIETEARDFGLTARCGIAGTVGAAWALARFAGIGPGHDRNGDAIDQEARATRSRAAKRRHWERGGTAPAVRGMEDRTPPNRIAPTGGIYQAITPLPVAALRITQDETAALNRLGLRRIGDLLGQPRAPLARRFGKGLMMRLDQITGAMPEPVSPSRPPPRFATRLSLPDPIGLREDMAAALDRLVPRLCELLETEGQGARLVRLEAHRCDGGATEIEIGLARPADTPHRIRPLINLRLDDIDAGFGIDMMRLEAIVVEPMQRRTIAGHLEAAAAAHTRMSQDTALQDLLGRLGGRVGFEAITRRHPVSSHIPEKTAQVLAAAWSDPAKSWPAPATPRPLMIWRPEPVQAPDAPHPADCFRWRGRDHMLCEARGPERIAPEWWLDDPDWRSGVRDYWHVVTNRGERLWLFYAHGGTMSSGWFCQGQFA
ncbi:MAG: DNA polymerase Y family protein [Pseudomonadota bacterium]